MYTLNTFFLTCDILHIYTSYDHKYSQNIPGKLICSADTPIILRKRWKLQTFGSSLDVKLTHFLTCYIFCKVPLDLPAHVIFKTYIGF